MSNSNEKIVSLNERSLTWEQFLAEKEKQEKKPGVKIVEVKPGVYKTQING